MSPLGRRGGLGRERVRGDAEIGGQRADQRGIRTLAVAALEPGQRHQEVGALLPRRCPSQDVQPISNLKLLQLAEMVVDGLQRRVVVAVQAEILVEPEPARQVEDVATQWLEAAGVELERGVVLVDQRLEVHQLAMRLGTGQGRGEVVDDDGGGAPLGLAAFARIVDDEGVEVGQRPEGDLRPAGRGKRQCLARQPFEIAVLAEMDDGLGAEFLAQPQIEGEVAVRRDEVGAVVGLGRVDVVAARRLDAEDDVAEAVDGEAKGAVLDERVGRWLAPALAHRVAGGLRPCRHGCQVDVERQADGRDPLVAAGKRIGRASLQQRHQVGGGFRFVCNVIAGVLQ